MAITSIRNLATHNQRRIAQTARTISESYHTFAQHRAKRNGRFDLGALQTGRIRLRPCGATFGSVGTCTTVL